ncbi:ABC transporter substrate-binding protein [Roseomonas sp. USHLN139]|uniref:ABC transporter substrate-binding protein n=1 Tax=Roseomonas sp. USHLN139 TaxID=3081298 RepID=UPI003B022426
MKRRTFLAAGAGLLAAPAIGHAQQNRVLRFIPQTDLTVLDPVINASYATRNHGYMVFDTLYGTDTQFRVTPQMVEGHVVENGGRLWKLILREGLKWHDGERVLARDCVASIRRWAVRDAFGQGLMAATEELSAPDDRTIQFRLKAPFPLLPEALGKMPSLVPVMMPERLAKTDPFTQVTEMVGSGPFRFLADERVSGVRVAYARFDGYVPRSGGTADGTAGPKVVHVDRVEWTTIPDGATAAAAMRSGEQDWLEFAANDVIPLLARARSLKVAVQEQSGMITLMRMNHLQPPFDNPAIRRALLGAVNQADFVQAVAGADPAMWHAPIGFFTPGSPMASDAGMEVFKGPRDYDKVKRELAAAGYKGEKVVLLGASDPAFIGTLAEVAADMLRKAGMNVDLQMSDWGTLTARRLSREPVEKGGWSCLMTALTGVDMANPALQLALRGNGDKAMYGWPNLPELEALVGEWFAAEGLAAQQAVARRLQLQAMQDLPYIPTGQFLQAAAQSAKLQDVVRGFPVFWNVRKV